MEKKNYIDEKGNYHNIENLTFAQIYASGVQEGYRKARKENDMEEGHDSVSGDNSSES